MPFSKIGNLVELKVSEGTVWRVLAEKGYHRRVARKVLNLTKVHRRAWVSWARLYKKFREEQWRKVIWSDECHIYLSDNQGCIYVTRQPDEELHDDCLVPTFKQSSVQVMVLGCIMWGQKGPLIVLEYPGGKGGGTNSKRYQQQVLDGVLKDFYTKMKQKRGCVLFQQDNASSHTSKSTQHWFLHENIPLLFHPANSPDINPIEPVWHELKKIIWALPSPSNTIEKL
jgi:DDE superfamily endonuclease/Transposase